MSDFPASTVKVTSIEPHGDTSVLIKMEMVVDVNRLAEVGSHLLQAAIGKMKEDVRSLKE